MGGHLFAFDTANLRQPFRAAMVCPVINRCEKEDYERKWASVSADEKNEWVRMSVDERIAGT